MGIGDSQSLNKNFKKYCMELKQTINPNNNVLFINCPQFNFNAFEQEVAKNRGYYAYPSTGLQYLIQALQNRNLNIKILDLNFEFLKRVIYDKNFDYKNWISILDEYLKENNPSIIGISNFYKIDNPAFVQVAQFLRKRQQKHIILAGAHYATYSAKEFLEKNLCNFVCERESENKINFLFDNLFKNQNNKETPGIWFKYNNKIERTEGERDIVELKGNLIDTYNLIPIQEYCKVGSLNPYSRMVGKNTPFAAILLNRGCEGNCKFCGVRDYMGFGVRTRKVKDVLDEIEYLYKERGIRHFDWIDDDFSRYNEKTLEVLQGIIDRNIKITWSCNNGFIIRTLNRELMKKMRDSGCIGFHVGIESGNQEILKAIRKTGNIEIFKNFSKIAQEFSEMFIIDNYIFGFPNETFSQILESYQLSIEMNLDWSSYAVYQPNLCYFGSNEEKKKIKDENIGDFVPTKDIIKGKLDSSEKILQGKKIFSISKDTIPTKEQLNQIWFTFNLVRNFILNKNLIPGGNPEKFVNWLKVLQERYPTHPYITFFLSLAYLLKNNKSKTDIFYKKTIENLRENYWKKVFDNFGLTKIIENFPTDSTQAKEILNFLRKEYEK